MIVPVINQNSPLLASQEDVKHEDQIVVSEQPKAILGQMSPFIQNRIRVMAQNNRYNIQSMIEFNTAILDQMKQIKQLLEEHAKEKALLINRISTLESEKKKTAEIQAQQLKSLEAKNNQLRSSLDNILSRLSNIENQVTSHYNIFQKALYEAGNGAFSRILSLDERLRLIGR